ncbi:head GIN domain-containing protein [Pedobacter sp. SYSU D00535]|uniref:head GIN domain-containing protein n=1 Tax=Pedobacter sp. SYSU D00535 TaxID=2810308 RepID=UPI001A961F2A|nr:head GIN domain-containing protein [Pedobacter sp. SYSU D00535]
MKTLFFLTFLGFFFISCTKERIEANGNIQTEVRTPREFHHVLSSGSKRIHIKYGAEYKVELRGSSNLLPRFKTEVIGGTLKLGYERVNVTDDDVEVVVTMPIIKGVNLSGSGKVHITGDFPFQDVFDVRISGSGDVEVQDGFDAEEVEVTISGSGDANLQSVFSKRADVNISGSGDATVSVEDHLKARISGSGKIYYHGSPQIDSRISGSGELIRF